jgi:Transposase DDE domain
MADIKGRSFKTLWPKRFRTSKSKSSNGRITPKASRFSHSVGLPMVRQAHHEGTFAWLNRCRRLAKDFENLTRNALAFLRLASIRLMLRKLCNQ